MADRLILDTPRFKGEWDFDLGDEPLTALEWRWIKKVSGYLPLTIDEGVAGLDPDLFIAIAVIVLVRVGRVQRGEALAVADILADLPADGSALKVVFDDTAEEEEGEGDPPAVAAVPPTEPPPNDSGKSSPLTLAPQDEDQRAIGPSGSARSAI